MQKSSHKHVIFKAESQKRPGLEYKMTPVPEFEAIAPGSNKLHNKKCVITGGDSGIGRAVAIAFANEGADVAIIYLKEEVKDAQLTSALISEIYNKKCITVASDISREKNCSNAIKKITYSFKHIDVLVNNAAVHYPADSILKISTDQLIKTFSVNIFSMFWITKSALPFMKKGSCIINSTSVTAYRGSAALIDYSATKGAIVSFTRSLSANLVEKGIRVNGVAPGPVWTPLIPSSFPAKKIKTYGTDTPMKRPAQPAEIAPAYVFLACDDSKYITGQFIHPNGGEIING